MSIYTKDHLLDGKIVYFQPKLGFRSGIEPIILASQANNKDQTILDLGSGCGPISLILAHRFANAEIVGLENNTFHLELSQKSKIENKENFYLVDVREDSEWIEGNIPNSIHIGKGVIERDITQLIPDKGAEIVLYCQGGFRSALAGESIQKMGYTNVFSMSGGYSDWINNN